MKQHTRWTRLLATPLAALMLVLAGCETTQLDEPTAAPVESRKPVAGTAGAAGGTPGAAAAGTPQSQVATVALPGSGAGATPSSERSVYFDYDDFSIHSPGMRLVERHGSYLAARPGTAIKIEGNADERGSREYNLALGQKRAQAVLAALKVYGVRDSQMEAVSWGEDKPVNLAHDESAWQQNRRADLRYPAR